MKKRVETLSQEERVGWQGVERKVIGEWKAF